MMNAGPRSSQAYDDLKSLILSGTIVPGERLDPVRLAGELVYGITPLREALLRLAGERLVEIRLNTGFYLPVITETVLVDLYRLRFELLRIAVATSKNKRPLSPASLSSYAHADSPVPVFLEIADSSDRPELAAHLNTVNDRLASAHSAETLVFGDTLQEISSINRARLADAKTLIRVLRGYHSRRFSNARMLVAAIYAVRR